MRINNLEFKQCSYIGDPPEHIGYEICLWQPNPYYGRESEFVKDGKYYRPNTDNYSFISIHESCFKYPETNIQIASWYWNDNEEVYDFEFCGNRPVEYLVNWEDFEKLVRYGFEFLNGA